MSIVHSYSKWSTFDKCPAKYKYRYIDRVPIPDSKSPQQARGTDIHDTIEKFLLGSSERMHDDVHTFYEEFMTMLRKLGAQPELKVAVKRDWTPTTFDDPEAYLRAVLDILLYLPEDRELHIYELKTGREYDDHATQRHMYGTLGLTLYPEVEHMKVHMIYLDLKKTTWYGFDRIFLPMLKETWERRLGDLEQEEDFAAMPGMLCRYCPYSKANNGPCQF